MNTLPDWGENSYININSNVNISSKIITSNPESSISLLSKALNSMLDEIIKKSNINIVNYDPNGKIPFPKESIYKEIPPNGIDLDDPF